MDKTVNALKKVVASKEYKDLVTCASKHCEEYENILDEEQKLVKDVSDLQASMNKIKDINEMLKRSKDIIDKSIKLLELNQNKGALMCIMKKCGNEYTNMVSAKNKHMADAYRLQIKQLDKTINIFSKKDKVKK